jgi:hypothetical protein
MTLRLSKSTNRNYCHVTNNFTQLAVLFKELSPKYL